MMRFAIVFAAGLAGLARPASANSVDDYLACMVGKATVAINNQSELDLEKAKAAAASQCPRPKQAASGARLDASIDTIIKAIARTRDASCASVLEAMKKQSALPVFGAAVTLDGGPARELIYTQTDIFTATGNGRWHRKPKSPEERDQDRRLAKYSSQLQCSRGEPDTLNNTAAKLYGALLDTIVIREWISQTDGLPMRQEETLARGHKRVIVWNYNVKVPASDKVDPQ